MLRPRALKPGDTVASSRRPLNVFDLWRIDDVGPRLAALGLKTKLGANVRARRGYLAGTEEQRLADLHAMFGDPDVAAVFCLGGGYGAHRLLDRIDYGLIRRNPKIFLGLFGHHGASPPSKWRGGDFSLSGRDVALPDGRWRASGRTSSRRTLADR